MRTSTDLSAAVTGLAAGGHALLLASFSASAMWRFLHADGLLLSQALHNLE